MKLRTWVIAQPNGDLGLATTINPTSDFLRNVIASPADVQ